MIRLRLRRPGGLFLLISCKSLQKKQAFEMTPPKERHQTDREWVGGATPFVAKNLMVNPG
jgi:hypothetical protein